MNTAAIAQHIDTLTCDTTLLHSFRQNPYYDYNQEIAQTDAPSLLDNVFGAINRGLNSLLDVDSSGGDDFLTRLWLLVGVIVVIVVVYYLIKKHPHLFARHETVTEALDYQEIEEDIHELDLDTLLSQALEQGNVRQVCRLRYLITLKALADAGAIDWQRYKTPSQYAAEYPSPEFRALTREFLRIRYGDFQATVETYDAMTRTGEEVVSQLQQEGGEPL